MSRQVTLRNGRRGIVLDDSHGFPVGCTRLERKEMQGANKKTRLAAGDDFGLDIADKQFKVLSPQVFLDVIL